MSERFCAGSSARCMSKTFFRQGLESMGWIANRLRRGLTNRSYQQICREVGSAGGGSAMFAVAIAEAVYPDARYGSEEWDGLRSFIDRKPVVDKRVAAQISEAWVDRAEMTWDRCISRLYGCDPRELLPNEKPLSPTSSQTATTNSGNATDVATQLKRDIENRVASANDRV